MTGPIRVFRVPSPAMEPTIETGARVAIDEGAYRRARPRRGDIVVFHPPVGADTRECGIPSEPADGRPCERPVAGLSRSFYIKRVVALPREWVYVSDNRLFIGSSKRGPFREIREPFIRASPCDDVLCNLRKPVRIPPGDYFVLGDNRGESDDSRDWGPIPQAAIEGRVFNLKA